MKNIFCITLLCLIHKTILGLPLSDTAENNISASNDLRDYVEIADMRIDVTDDAAPAFLKSALADAAMSKDNTLNQYSEGIGKPRLLEAIAKYYSNLINIELDPATNVLATVGATEALYDALNAFTKSGDEWIIIEPFWSKYEPMVKLAHGIPRFTSLKLTKTTGDIDGNDWILDKDEFASLINNKTRGIFFNNPNNPTGRVYTLDDLLFIADLAKKHDLIVISDEVHEFVVFEPYKMIRMASLPGMFERTVTIGSASKAFNVAGWRVGWIFGPADLIDRVNYVHDFTVQGAPTPNQIAVAVGFEEAIEHYNEPHSFLAESLTNTTLKRNLIVQAFRDAGMLPVVPNGGNCMLASWPSIKFKEVMHKNTIGNVDVRFSKWLSKRIGVSGFAGAGYFSTGHGQRGRNYIRFCYQKNNQTLQIARENLLKLKPANLII